MATHPKQAPAVDGVARTAMKLRDSELTTDQIELLKRTVAKGATDDEFALFIETCNHTGLNPFVRQIYCLERRAKNAEGQWVRAMVTQTGIDGLRLVAQRTGEYIGQTQPVFYDAAGNERAVWLDPKKPPLACRVGVLRKGFAEPLYGVAHYSDYVQKKQDGQPNAMWQKPTIMMPKCAEALALRKAFPMELSGVYGEDEITIDPSDVIEEPPQKLVQAAKHVEHGSDGDPSAKVEGGSIVLTFGTYKDKPLKDVPLAYLCTQFRDAWKDATRRQTAIERLGEGFVNTVFAEISARIEVLKSTCAPLIAKGNARTDEETMLLDDLSQEIREAEGPASE